MTAHALARLAHVLIAALAPGFAFAFIGATVIVMVRKP
jgi:hypothetical protein